MHKNKRCEKGPCGKQCKRQQKHWEIPEFIIIAFDTHTVPKFSVSRHFSASSLRSVLYAATCTKSNSAEDARDKGSTPEEEEKKTNQWNTQTNAFT